MAKHGILVGITVAVTAVASVAGCSNNSNNKSNTGSSSSSAPAEKVVVDGQNQNVTGQVSCTPAGDNINIGIGDPTNGVGAVITNANPPAVQAVGLGSVSGVTLGYSAAAPNQGNAQTTKNGNSYRITGTATGVNMSSPDQPVTKSFELEVTCP